MITKVTAENFPKRIVSSYIAMFSNVKVKVYVSDTGEEYKGSSLAEYLNLKKSGLNHRESKYGLGHQLFLSKKISRSDRANGNRGRGVNKNSLLTQIPDVVRSESLSKLKLAPFDALIEDKPAATGSYVDARPKKKVVRINDVGEKLALKILARFNAKMERKGLLSRGESQSNLI